MLQQYQSYARETSVYISNKFSAKDFKYCLHERIILAIVTLGKFIVRYPETLRL